MPAKKIDPATLNHLDLIGKKIEMNCLVATAYFKSSLSICRVVSMAPKTIRLQKIGATARSKSFSKYPDEVLVLDDEDMTMYFLKRGAK